MAARDAPAQETIEFLAGGGELGARMRAHDWSASPLGPANSWPQPLKTLVEVMLAADQPMFVAWADERTLLYNDAYAPMLADRHPAALGRPFFSVWAEVRETLTPLFQQVFGGKPVHMEDIELYLDRPGLPREAHFAFGYTPVRDEAGRVAGLFCPCTETTKAVLGAKRREALFKLDEQLRDVANTADLSFKASEILGEALGAARVGYGAVDAVAGTIVVERNWYAPGFDDLAGVHHFADYGSYINDLRRGEAVANADVDADPRTVGNTGAFKALGIRAHLDVPVVEGGQLVGQMFVHSASQRVWTDEEVAFVRDFAERTRAAIARRKAEQELRESETRFRALATVGSSAVYRMSPDWREMRRLDGAGFMADTVAPTTGWVESYIPRDERQKVQESIDLAIEAGNVFELEHRVLRADGSVGWTFSRAIPLIDDDGEITEWFGAATDVTARVEADRSFTRLFAASPAPFLVVKPDAPRFTISEVNDAYLAATMRTRDDLVGRGIFNAFPGNPDDPSNAGVSRLRASLERVLATRQPDELPGLKYDIARPDGTFEERWWSPVNSPVLGEDGKVEALIHNANDVTEARLAEAALRESEARLRFALKAGRLGEWELNLTTGELTTSKTCRTNFGRDSSAPFTYEELRDAVHPEDKGRMTAAVERSVSTGEDYDIEYRVVTPMGEVRWVQIRAQPSHAPDGAPLRITGVSLDITERKWNEVRLRELNDTLEAQVLARSAERDRLWNLSQDMLARADYKGMMSAISPAWEKVLGWSEEELLRRGYATFMHPSDAPATLEAIRSMAETGEPTRFENRIATREGGWKHIGWTVAPEPDGLNFIAVGRDLSFAKARKADLAQAQELLRQSQKMEAMGSLTGGVAHDFNNLLTPIIGSLDLLHRKELGGEREWRLIDGALQSAERARVLVQRLLAFARRQPLQPRAVDIGALVSGMADLVASTTGPQIKVVVEVANELAAAIADPNQVEMAILNLSVNARDAMAEGGTIRITADDDAVDPGHRSKLKPGRYVRLSVADTGMGMDEETRARAIEPFFSTKGVGRGTGLGLSMVHGLASQLGGALNIESRPGVGTNVEMWLPATNEAAAQTEVVEQVEARPSAGVALLVDDEDLVRASTADMLAELGYAVVEAGSADDALRLVDGGQHLDVLVTDHLMPGMTGTELAREVRLKRRGVRVLVVSGYADVDGVASDLPRLAKPFRKADLAGKLSELDEAAPDQSRGTAS